MVTRKQLKEIKLIVIKVLGLNNNILHFHILLTKFVFSNYQSAQIKTFQPDFFVIEFYKLNFLTSIYYKFN